MEELKPIVTFGLITDVQYADHDDAITAGTVRYYRNSLQLIKKALDHWNKYEIESGDKLKFIISLGDLIDQRSKKDPQTAMNTVLTELSNKLTRENEPFILHATGNHEVYSMTRSELAESPLNTRRALGQQVKDVEANYYSIEITNKLQLIVLDFYDFSVFDQANPNRKQYEAEGFLQKFGMNIVDKMKHLIFSGGIRNKQMLWLKEQLEICVKSNKKAIICGHVPIHRMASSLKHVAANYFEILGVIRAYEGVCVAYFAGHYHAGAVYKDKTNILHITFPAVLETEPGADSFSTIQIYEDHINVKIVRYNINEYRIEI